MRISAVLTAAAVVTVTLLGPATASLAQRRVASLDAQLGIDTNPFSTPDDIAAGQASFISRCSSCHGPDGTGNRGPNLMTGRFRHGGSDGAMFNNILSGIPGTGMPSVRLSDKEMWQIVAYVRSLSRPASTPVPGNGDAGRRLFARVECAQCHFIGGEGGRLGPDLSEIGWLRSPTHLRASILDPDSDIDERFRQVHLTHVDRRQIHGLLRNEDAYSILVLDSLERLRAFSKSELRNIERPATSMMPSFAGRFTDDEVDVLVAYLVTLRR